MDSGFFFLVVMLILVFCCLFCAPCPVAIDGNPYVIRHRTKINPDMRDIVWSVRYRNGTKKELSYCYHENKYCFDFTSEFTPSKRQVGNTYKNTMHIAEIKPEHHGMTIIMEEMSRSSDARNLVYTCTVKLHGHHHHHHHGHHYHHLKRDEVTEANLLDEYGEAKPMRELASHLRTVGLVKRSTHPAPQPVTVDYDSDNRDANDVTDNGDDAILDLFLYLAMSLLSIAMLLLVVCICSVRRSRKAEKTQTSASHSTIGKGTEHEAIIA